MEAKAAGRRCTEAQRAAEAALKATQRELAESTAAAVRREAAAAAAHAAELDALRRVPVLVCLATPSFQPLCAARLLSALGLCTSALDGTRHNTKPCAEHIENESVELAEATALAHFE